MIINDVGQIMAIKITKGNVDDRTPVAELTKKLKGSIYADKGYIGADLFKALYKRGLKLITGIRKNMKNYLINLTDKKLLRKTQLLTKKYVFTDFMIINIMKF